MSEIDKLMEKLEETKDPWNRGHVAKLLQMTMERFCRICERSLGQDSVGIRNIFLILINELWPNSLKKEEEVLRD